MRIGICQMAPIWLDRVQTTEKIVEYITKAGKEQCDLIVFGEGLLPGYPFWVSCTGGAEFNSKVQKEIHAHYISEAVDISRGDLDGICMAAKENKVAVYLGTIERAADRGGHSLYCSLVYIDKTGEVKSVHRKLQPTYEERLVWAQGDGHGLKVHALEEFKVGGLNCWENWMPLSRTALYAQGENLHVAVWPGCLRNTTDITEFIAKESRSFVISVSGMYNKELVSDRLPHKEMILSSIPADIADGGSGLMDPSGKWVIEPVVGTEGLFTADINLDEVLKERQNFDVAGHYSRPDITKLVVNRARQSLAEFFEG